MYRIKRLFHIGFLITTGIVSSLCIFHLFYFYSRDHQLVGPAPTVLSRGFLVDTAACKIPNIDPFDPSIRDAVRRRGRIGCVGKKSVTYVDGTFLRLNRTRIDLELKGDFKYCKYQPISREGIKSDFAFAYGEFTAEIDKDVEMRDEFIRIYCYSRSEGVIATTFHAFILPKEHVERRCHLKLSKHLQHDKPKELFNVQMVGVDSVSRLNFMRQMPKTRAFLLDDLDAVEMLGYNKVADNTFVNIVPMMTGKFVEELPWDESMVKTPFDNYSFIWKNFSDAGYRTLYAEDAPNIAIFVYQKEGFHEVPADYYYRALSLAMEKHTSVWNHKHHCIMDTLETDMVLGYVLDFSRHFRHKPHFGFSFITRLTHDDANDAGAADEPHLTFLRKLKAEGHLNNTILIYYSDHGNRFGEMRSTYVGKAEERLPFLFLVFPEWFRWKYLKLYQNLRLNSNRLTTPFDVYETLKDILHFDGEVRKADLQNRGISLFQEIPETRSCAHAHILPHWCMCMERRRLRLDSNIVLKTASAMVRHINNMLTKHFSVCAKLRLKTILEAEQMVPNDNVLRFQESLNDVINRTVRYGNRTDSFLIYQISIRTDPGEGMFEGTLKYHSEERSFSLAGDISRINEYGTQSECIDTFNLKKFCYCLAH